MKEIGSEYWKIDNLIKHNNLDFLNVGQDNKLLMSGSTAIDFVLNDIKDTLKIVYMPDYCCESMVKPFIDNNYIIKYYSVDLINNEFKINTDEKCSIFFAMSYFGYSISNMDSYIEKFSKRKIIVIEDITHRLFCKQNHSIKSDYLIASLRKWFPIYTGGIAIKVDDKFTINNDNYVIDTQLVNIKKKAMELKRDYIDNQEVDKKSFLNLYKIANQLIMNYKNKLMDKESVEILKSIDIDKMIQTRRINAEIIEKKLQDTNANIIYKLSVNDCPLFVPILIKNRDRLRNCLINENIYCPIHWPNFSNLNNQIYNYELSLICDQRYNKEKIENYMDKLIKIIGR